MNEEKIDENHNGVMVPVKKSETVPETSDIAVNDVSVNNDITTSANDVIFSTSSVSPISDSSTPPNTIQTDTQTSVPVLQYSMSQPTQPQTTQHLYPQTQTVPSNPQTQTVPSNPQTQTVPSNPQTQTVPSNPQTQTVPSNPQTQTVPSNPQTQTVPSNPQTQTVPSNPHTQTVPSNPQTQTVPSNPQTQTVPSNPQTQTVPSNPQTQTVPSNPQTQTVPSNPQTQTIPPQISISTSSDGVESSIQTPLSETDIKLLALLQTNLPHLSHVQESIKSIIQNNLILQSMKSSLAKTPLISKPQQGDKGTNTATSNSLLRKPVLAQVISTESPGKAPSSASTSEPLGPVTTNIKPSPGPVTTPPSEPKPPPVSRREGKALVESSPLKDLATKLSTTGTLPDSFLEDPSESMEIDVGQTVEPLELPEHLKDHTYCVYNPTVCNGVRPSTERTGTIPVERLSYAPEVPDSPRTLFKLLKVLPKKGGSTSGGRSQGRSQGKMGGVTNVKGYISKTVGSRKRKSILGGRKSRIGDSGDESFGSGTPDVSDGEGESGSTRRRSQRNKGQRKHYVDDIKLSLSDEETLEDIMLPPPKKTGYFSMIQPDDDESDYDDSVSSGTPISKMLKYKKSITINPTEGFQYSDIYMDAPAEEAQVVEKILSHRVRPSELTGDDIEEFFVKYKNYSYLHVEWATSDKLTKGDKRFEGKAKRYKSKLKTLGLFANVDDEPFNPDFTVADRILDIATHVETNGEKVTHYLVKWKSLPYEDSTWELEEDLDKEVISNFLEFSTMPPDEELQYIRRFPPNKFKPIKESKEYKGSNKLRPYQLEGLNWLLFNWYTRQNCILADEMGLGKTVQSIAFILEIVSVGIRGPFLVIAPLSTISNWQREFETWSNLNVVIYHGSAYSRRMIHEYELYYRDLAGKIIIDAYKFNVLVTTYEVLLSDNSELQNILWRVVVIDEAHRLKNKNCKMLEGLRELRMEHRVLLTGTPLQNNVEELFSLLNFLEPSQFPSPQAFIQQFGDLKTEEEVDELKAVLKPMMLRRLKEDVEKSLAPKEETIIEIEMTSIQKQYYRAILERNFSFLSRGSSVPNLLNTMMELRKCCNHPFLIAGAESKIVDDFKIHYPNKNVFESLIQASGKLVLVDKLLPKLKEKGHKVLIFSQMVKCLDILEDYMRMKGHLYERIDGQVRGTLRQSAIDRFTKPEYERFVFLLCTRAGGLGINLTAADTVIIYDSDWNPQNDIQAQARCHRIGQNKMVKVYRLITTHSYEREMFDRASLKLGLDKAVLQSMNTQQQANGPPQLSKQEIENLLKKGAYGAIMDSDDAANQFCEEDIELILERRTQVIQLESEGKGSTFSKASFVVDGTTDISVDDPDFWKKWAQKANLNLDQLARKDTLVMDEPRVRRQVRRYGEEMLETIIDSMDHIEDILPSRGRKGWTKLECFKTEKALLIYGWGQWDDILNYSKFKKRQLTIRDTENISRTMLVYCLNHFNGDEKVQLYIHQLIDPSVTTEDTQKSSGFYTGFTEDDYLALMAKDPETLFQEESYMKHLRRHATRILLRVRQLHMIRWQIMKPYMSQITSDSLARDLKFTPPRPEEEPPASWWDELCDTSLLVAIVKHGYEQFKLWRADKCLCFWELVGEQQLSFHQATPSSSKKKKKYREEEIDLEAELEEGEDYSDDGYSNSTTPSTSSHRLITTIRKTRAATAALMTTPSNSSLIDYQVGPYVWPSLAEINTRARRLVNSYLKQQKRLEMKQAQLMKEQERKVREAEVSRKRELKKAELAQKWSKREEQDFARVISFFGIEYNEETQKCDWTRFRQLANLAKKSDERLNLYYQDFKEMCRQVIKKKRPKLGHSGVMVEGVNEERAIKCLQRIDLLTSVRNELLPHPDFDNLINLCQSSFEVPHWWLPKEHDRDLLRGVAKHGLYRTDFLLYNDPDLCFLKTVPKSALFTPTFPSKEENEDDDSGESEKEGDGQKIKTSQSTPVPLGWPKEKAVLIRISRIAYAFRNKVWPKPMEGLELFNPVPSILNEDDSDSTPSSSPSIRDSDEEEDDGLYTDVSEEGSEDEENGRARGNLTMKISKLRRNEEDPLTFTLHRHDNDATTPTHGQESKSYEENFQVQKQQGLKLTLKKGRVSGTPGDDMEMSVKIPLANLHKLPPLNKRISKKRSLEQPPLEPSKKSKQSKMIIIDPTKTSVDNLTGNERVSVINTTTNDKLPINHCPTLKKLQSWLTTHPHYTIDSVWTALANDWISSGVNKQDNVITLINDNNMET